MNGAFLLGYVLDSEGRTVFVVDAHRGDGKRFVVRADEKLTKTFVQLESVIRLFLSLSMKRPGNIAGDPKRTAG